ncbi:MAG: class I SAM-dependent methyltransferase [Pirellulales bacterium]
MKDKHHEQWEKLGATDPYWAVLSNPKMKNDKWNRTEFFQRGEMEVVNLMTKFEALGIDVELGSVLDFGCGVGRVSRALSERFRKVIAIDVSRSMLQEAQNANQHIDNIDFIHNAAEDLSIISDDSVDCLYTNMVLQHMPKKRQVKYIREFCRVLQPKGILVMKTQSKSNLKTWKGWVYLLTGNYGINIINKIQIGYFSGMEMHTIPKKTVLNALDDENMTIVKVDKLASGHSAVIHPRYFAEKS